MRYLILLITILCFSCGGDQKKNATSTDGVTTTYYLIRHAEKDRATINDPELLPKGKKRAEYWAIYFREIPLAAIYSTDYKRTKQTATPIAKSKAIPVQLYSAENLYNMAFQEATEGKHVLVVGHSNTTPAFVNTIIGEKKYSPIHDLDNSKVYKVVVAPDGSTEVTIETVDM